MKSIDSYAKEWEQNASIDPFWAILTADASKEGKWEKETFFQTGTEEIGRLFKYMEQNGIQANLRTAGLDFGCGLGRVTQALKGYFQKMTGVDISSQMVDQAKLLHPLVEFVHNPRSDLSAFPDKSFDFIYSNIVLQHMNASLQTGYISEFGRVLQQGGLAVFQIPSLHRIKGVKQWIGSWIPYSVKKKILMTLGWLGDFESRFSIEMNVQSESEVINTAKKAGLELVHLCYSNSTDPNFCGNLQFYSAEVEALKNDFFSSAFYFFRKR